MGILHVAPGASAGYSLRQAVHAIGRDDQVIRHMDDLSCGPIASDDPLARGVWWQQFSDEPAGDDILASESQNSFWHRIASSDDYLVVWFALRHADELAFFQAWADRLGERAYDVVDVTDLELPRGLPDGSTGLYSPVQAASLSRSPGQARS